MRFTISMHEIEPKALTRVEKRHELKPTVLYDNQPVSQSWNGKFWWANGQPNLPYKRLAVTKFGFCSHTTARGWPWGRGCLPSLIARQNISLLATAHDCETGSDTQLGSVGGMRMDIQLWHKHTLEPD